MIDSKQIIQETLDIIKNGEYEFDGKKICLGKDFGEIIILSPLSLENSVKTLKTMNFPKDKQCEILVENSDSLEAVKNFGKGKTLVLNFASAYHPGGRFLAGSMAQEEMLCRKSTLYASLSSDKAKQVYDYNNQNQEPGGSDYILLTPNVIVFRNSELNLDEPYETSVISSAALNIDKDAENCSKSEIREHFCRKIRNIVATAVEYGYETLILGAWGCGAFGNDARDVSEYFYEVLVEEGMQRYFDRIVFAIYTTFGRYNITQFKKRFGVND